MTRFVSVADDPMLPILDRAFDGIALVAPAPWRLVFVNRRLANWLAKPAAELREMPLEHAFQSVWQRGTLEELLNSARQNPSVEADATLHFPLDSGEIGAARVRAFQVFQNEDPLLGLVVRPLASTHVDYQAGRIDPLTSLPDRAFLLSRLKMLLSGNRAVDRDFAVLFIDLDNFKRINDHYGHLIGDRVLKEVAQRLLACVREGDHVTRYGGDEFVVLLERVTGSSEIAPVLARIRAALFDPIVLADGRFVLSLSIGVANSAPHLCSPEDVLGEADRAMYAAKRGVSVAPSGAATA